MYSGNSNSYDLHNKKQYWKLILLLVAVVIIMFSIWVSNYLVMQIARDEKMRIYNWAVTIKQRSQIVTSTNKFFKQIQDEERAKVELYAEAQKKIAAASLDEDISFYNLIIEGNKTIPVILTDEDGNIRAAVNTVFTSTSVPGMKDYIEKEFSVYPPIPIRYYKDEVNYIYYKDSKLFTEVQDMINSLISSFYDDIVNNAASVPVIIYDSAANCVVASGNIPEKILSDKENVTKLINEMKAENSPISFDIEGKGSQWIYYKNSKVLTQLRYYPYLQFAIIGVFFLISYMLFSTSKRSEQNQVWAGLAKETAHQLGTPLSSLLAWTEYLKDKDVEPNVVGEMQKDVERLNTVASRFSKIGSVPTLTQSDIVSVVDSVVKYLKTRTSQKISYKITSSSDLIMLPLNVQLFGWVIENLIKNAIDAIGGSKGKINIIITEQEHTVTVDIEDTGKGIPRNMHKAIFNPGYTSKARGWGLGLSLAKRIINDYHKGKIFVKSSVVGKGSTLRIILNK